MRATSRLVPIGLALAAVVFAGAPFIVGNAPYESTMGLVQKIFYFHVPAAIVAMLSAFVSGIASARFLWGRRRAADHLAVAAAELVVLFGTIVLVTGPLWARKSWGVWWQWDARVMSTFVMWLIFIAYLLLRRFGGPGSEVLSSAVGVFGMALVPFVYWSVNIWRTIHPPTSVVPSLPAPMLGPFLWCLTGFLFLYLVLLFVRARLEASRTALDEAVLALED